MQNPTIHVATEVGTLRKLLVHSPDSGLGKVVPSKAQDWLFEDIIHLDTMRRHEYDYYFKILLYFLDPNKIKGKLASIDADESRSFFKPESEQYVNSDKVIEVQRLLSDILADESVKVRLISAVCAVEHGSYTMQSQLAAFSPVELAKVLISGMMPDKTMLFPPIPNFIFTRDIGITINDHLLLNKPAKDARTREALLMQYVFFNHSIFEEIREKIIEIPENEYHFLMPDDEQEDSRATLEGGDVMMVAPNHLLIGISERTSVFAAKQVIKALFQKQIVEKVSLVKIPKKRDYMHIDTVFTQVKRNMWVVLGSIAKQMKDDAFVKSGLMKTKKSEQVKIVQFRQENPDEPREIEDLETLLREISQYDLDSLPQDFTLIYSGNNEFPYGAREQWTDSCNLLALKEGVVIGYDRNDKTLEAFKAHGFETIKAADLLQQFEKGEKSPQTLENTFILLPSAELSRARGGSHCMSMPLLRDSI